MKRENSPGPAEKLSLYYIILRIKDSQFGKSGVKQQLEMHNSAITPFKPKEDLLVQH